MRILVTLFSVVFLNYSVFAQSQIPELEIYFDKALKTWNVPGMSVGIIKDGKVLLAKGYGVLETGGKEEPNSETMYAIASNTKAFTSAAIATLVDKNKLNWNDPVRRHIPNFTLYDDYTSENVTVRDILCHRVGYGHYSGDVIWYKSERPASELLPHIKYVPKAFDFRDGYGYSNLMFITAGEVIRAASGLSWDQYLSENFLQPLGMTRTVMSVTDLEKFDNVATPHKTMKDGNLPLEWANWDNMGSAGAIVSCVDDMLKWINLHLNKGTIEDKTCFSRNAQEELWHPHNSFKVTDNLKKTYPTRNFAGYGLGWSVYDQEGYKIVTHGGAYDGMYSKVVLVPDQKLGFVILTNSMTSICTDLANKVLDNFLGGKVTNWTEIVQKNQTKYQKKFEDRKAEIRAARVKGTKPTARMSSLAGIYYDDMYGADITVELNDAKELRLHFEGAPQLAAKLTHWHYNTYKINWQNTHAWFDFGTIQFVTNNDNEVTAIEFDVPNGDIFFHEIKAKKIK